MTTRPNILCSYVTTPSAGEMVQLLGGSRHGSVTLTTDEFRAVQRLYGYAPEKPNPKPPPPVPPPPGADYTERRAYEEAVKAHRTWKDPRVLMQAGADHNAFRHAELDGLRLLAWIARFVPAGEDPLKSLVQLAVDAGWDMGHEDAAWAYSEDHDELDTGTSPA